MSDYSHKNQCPVRGGEDWGMYVRSGRVYVCAFTSQAKACRKRKTTAEPTDRKYSTVLKPDLCLLHLECIVEDNGQMLLLFSQFCENNHNISV